MGAGQLDEIIYLQKATTTSPDGAVTKTWDDVDDPGTSPRTPEWAEVISEKGTDSFEAARRNAEQTIRVKIRYRDDVSTEWRLEWESEFYYVSYVDQSSRRAGYTWITAKSSGAK